MPAAMLDSLTNTQRLHEAGFNDSMVQYRNLADTTYKHAHTGSLVPLINDSMSSTETQKLLLQNKFNELKKKI